jgi:hypothetical protein
MAPTPCLLALTLSGCAFPRIANADAGWSFRYRSVTAADFHGVPRPLCTVPVLWGRLGDDGGIFHQSVRGVNDVHQRMMIY